MMGMKFGSCSLGLLLALALSVPSRVTAQTPPSGPQVPGAAPAAQPQPVPVPPPSEPVQQQPTPTQPGQAPPPAPAPPAPVQQPVQPAPGQATAQQPAGPPPPVSGYPSQAGTQPGPPGYPAQPPPGYYPYYEPPPPPPPPEDDPAEVRTHDGFYLRLGLGPSYGWGKTEIDDFEITYTGAGFLLDIMLGGTIGNMVIIGGGLQLGQIFDPQADTGDDSVMSVDTGDEGLGITTLGPFVDVYFGKQNGGHVGTMLGIGSIGLEGEDDSQVSTGWGWSLFGGYDFWVSDQWAMGANLRYTRVRGERIFGEVEDSPFDSEITVRDTAHTLGIMFSAVLN